MLFFDLGDKEKCLLVALNRWLSYAIKITQEFTWVDSALVVLDE